jgi:sensor histidine kinase YesM
MPTNREIAPMNQAGFKGKLNDIGFRVILIPFFGIAIPLITGMLNGQHLSLVRIKFSFLYSILIAWVIWEGNRYLLFSIRSYFDWYKKPVRKILALLFAISFYTLPVSSLLLVGWYHIFVQTGVDWQTVFTAALTIMVFVIFITHVYETVFLVKESENEMLRAEQLERTRAEAELEALKNQIDPHFIFNSLNTLSYLIEEDPGRAKQFNDNLADVYRYILQNKARGLVLLQEEINFVKDYFSLLKIRFEKAVQFNIDIDPALFEQYLVPPISLQVLLENAIKHNEFSDNTPLLVQLQLEGSNLVFRNGVKKKQLRKPSSAIGLKNLEERYMLTTGQTISVAATETMFTVKLPVLKIE